VLKQNLIIFSFFMMGFGLSSAQASHFIKGGFVEFNIYPYQTKVDTDATLAINAFMVLPNRLSYFSLTNFRNAAGDAWYPELDAYYSEHNLRWQISEGSAFQLTAQANFREGANNDRYRLGVRWHLNKTAFLSEFLSRINLSYSINLHALQFDHEDPYVWQLEHAFLLKLPLISDRLYVAGFMDHTFNQDLPSHFPSNPIVAETQLGYRIIDSFYVVTEYRINEYRRADVNNISVGFEYKVKL